MQIVQKSKWILMIAVLAVGVSSQVFAAYTPNLSGLTRKTVNAGNSANAIKSAMGSGNVVITLKSGTHNLTKNIVLKSNTHIRFESGVTVNQKKAGVLFSLDGGNNSVVGPVQINCWKPTTSNSLDQKGAAANATCNHFLIQNLTIRDYYSMINVIGTGKGAKNGTIANIKATGCAPGYGLYQAQAGENIHCSNLNGTGGFTYRLEQGDVKGRLHNMTASNIKCRKGRGPVFLGPNTISNGSVSVNGITSYGCQWGAWANSKNGGSFSSASIANVTARYGTAGQFKNVAAGFGPAKAFIPDSLQVKVKGLPNKQGGMNGKFSKGPSFGCILDDPRGAYSVSYSGTNKRTGFPTAYQNDPIQINSSNWDSTKNAR